MIIYRSLDFEALKKRLEKTSAGEYLVHTEDFESLNDLIRKAERTRSRLPDFTDDDALYYEVPFDEVNDQNSIDQSPNMAIDKAEEPVQPKQSEGGTAPKALSDEPSVTQ